MTTRSIATLTQDSVYPHPAGHSSEGEVIQRFGQRIADEVLASAGRAQGKRELAMQELGKTEFSWFFV